MEKAPSATLGSGGRTMPDQGQPNTPREKSLLFNYGAAFAGIIVGALLGAQLLGYAFNDNPALAAGVGGAVGGVIGFAIPGLLKMMGVIKPPDGRVPEHRTR